LAGKELAEAAAQRNEALNSMPPDIGVHKQFVARQVRGYLRRLSLDVRVRGISKRIQSAMFVVGWSRIAAAGMAALATARTRSIDAERAVLARVMDTTITARAQAGKYQALRLVAEHDTLVAVAERLIGGGAKVDGDALHITCRHGSVQIARQLIAARSQVDAILSGGYTPLQVACREGHVQVATLLLAAGASVNRAGDQGYIPLLDAVRGDYTEATSVLIAAGGDVNYTMASAAMTHGASRTPSFAAVFYAHAHMGAHMVDRLIAAGVDISMPCCSSSRTVLYFAFPYRYHNPEIMQQLRAAGDP